MVVEVPSTSAPPSLVEVVDEVADFEFGGRFLAGGGFGRLLRQRFLLLGLFEARLDEAEGGRVDFVLGRLRSRCRRGRRAASGRRRSRRLRRSRAVRGGAQVEFRAARLSPWLWKGPERLTSMLPPSSPSALTCSERSRSPLSTPFEGRLSITFCGSSLLRCRCRHRRRRRRRSPARPRPRAARECGNGSRDMAPHRSGTGFARIVEPAATRALRATNVRRSGVVSRRPARRLLADAPHPGFDRLDHHRASPRPARSASTRPLTRCQGACSAGRSARASPRPPAS